MNLSMLLLTLLVIAPAQPSTPSEGAITQDELVRRTQELFDSVAPGNAGAVQKIFCRRRNVL